MDEGQGRLVDVSPAEAGRRKRGTRESTPNGEVSGGEGGVEAAPAEPVLPAGTRLRRKLLAVMGDVHRVQKRGRNAAQNYRYAQESDLAEAVRPLLVKHGVTLIPLDFEVVERRERETRSGAHETLTRITATYELFDVDSGESLTFKVSGEGADTGDKGPYKAMTGAGKYALLKLFWIPTGDEPEADEKTDRRQQEDRDPPVPDPTKPITQQMRTRLDQARKAGGHTPEQAREWLAREFGYETTTDVTFKDFDAIMRRLASKESLPAVLA